MKIGPVGKVAIGHVLDVNKRRFEKALRDYDPMLYVKWNPKKLHGHGVWEIRRKPEFLTAVDVAEVGDDYIIKLDLYENDLVHHVLDCAFLNYDQIRKLQEMDTWRYGDATTWQDMIEQKTLDRQAHEIAAGQQRRREAARTFKKQIQALKEHVLNGGNPHDIGKYWETAPTLE